MKKTLLLAGVAVCAFAFNANALDFKPYISAKINHANVKSDMVLKDGITRINDAHMDASDTVWGSSIAAGIATTVGEGTVRAELEFNHHQKARERLNYWGFGVDSSVKTQAYFLNAYYDFDNDSKFTPYIGAGIGRATVKAHYGELGVAFYESHEGLAWNLGAGVSYKVCDHSSIDVGYRYINYGEFSKLDRSNGFAERMDVDTEASELYLGFRYTF